MEWFARFWSNSTTLIQSKVPWLEPLYDMADSKRVEKLLFIEGRGSSYWWLFTWWLLAKTLRKTPLKICYQEKEKNWWNLSFSWNRSFNNFKFWFYLYWHIIHWILLMDKILPYGKQNKGNQYQTKVWSNFRQICFYN